MNLRTLFTGFVLVLAKSPLAAQEAERLPRHVCDSVRALLKVKGDSLLAVKPQRWRPDPSVPGQVEGVRTADVVVLVRVDTLGKPDLSTFTPVKWRDFSLIPVARQQLLGEGERIPYEPFPGCRASYVLTVPMRFGTLRR